MAESKTNVCNLAVSHLGSAKEIGDIVTENSQEARACRRFFDQVNDELTRGFAWPFLKRFKTLDLVEANPTTEWAFAYRYPSTCKYARRILSGTRNDSRQSRVPYLIGADDTGKLIYSDKPAAVLEYTTRSDDISRWPADFVQAFAYRLAAYIAPRITGGDPNKLGQTALSLFNASIEIAMAASLNEQQDEEPVESEYIRARDT